MLHSVDVCLLYLLVNDSIIRQITLVFFTWHNVMIDEGPGRLCVKQVSRPDFQALPYYKLVARVSTPITTTVVPDCT